MVTTCPVCNGTGERYYAIYQFSATPKPSRHSPDLMCIDCIKCGGSGLVQYKIAQDGKVEIENG